MVPDMALTFATNTQKKKHLSVYWDQLPEDGCESVSSWNAMYIKYSSENIYAV